MMGRRSDQFFLRMASVYGRWLRVSKKKMISYIFPLPPPNRTNRQKDSLKLIRIFFLGLNFFSYVYMPDFFLVYS